jgi:hypothetical protein
MNKIPIKMVRQERKEIASKSLVLFQKKKKKVSAFSQGTKKGK